MFIKTRFFLFAVVLFSVFSIFFLESAKASEAASSGAAASGSGDKRLKFSFSNKPILDVISVYAKASGQTFVIDPALKGPVTILSSGEVTVDQAFDLLSTSLSLLQFAIVHRGDKLLIESTRNAMHDVLPVVTELPSESPDQYLTYVYTPKLAPVDELFKNLRSLVSRDGEMLSYKSGNALIMSDWVSNLRKIKKILDAIDVPSSGHERLRDPIALNMKD